MKPLQQPEYDPNDPKFRRGMVAFQMTMAVVDAVETFGPEEAAWMLSLALEQAKAELAKKLERPN